MTSIIILDNIVIGKLSLMMVCLGNFDLIETLYF